MSLEYNPFEDVEFRARNGETLEWVEKINSRPFDHEKVARHLFTTKKESDIVSTISKLTELQSDIDQVLRDKVTNNYSTFIRAKDSIRRTGIELSELRSLVDSTRGIIKDVRNQEIHLDDDSSMRKNSFIDVVKTHKKELTRDNPLLSQVSYDEKDNGGNESSSSTTPKWLHGSPNNLTKYIIEKNFSAAVTEILKVRQYKESSDNNIDDATERAKVVRICMTIDELGLVVARDLMHSLVKLPNSPIWGGSEQRRRLKLLISLGHYDFAAEAFSNASNDIIQTVLNDVEVSGDTQTYIMDLSKTFFASLQKVTVNFVTLFADYVDSPGVMSILVSWAHDQVAALAGIICHQIELGAKELGALTVIHLKPKTLGSVSASRRPSVTFAEDTLPIAEDGDRVSGSRGRQGSILAGHGLSTAEVEELFGTEEPLASSGSGELGISSGGGPLERAVRTQDASADKYLESLHIAFSPGPLTFVRRCLDVALTQSQQYASVALQGLDDLGWFMVPELKRSVMQYAEDLMTETVSQVKQDSWSGVTAPFWEVQCAEPGRGASGSASAPPSRQPQVNEATGSSFVWFTLSLSHYLSEVLALLRAGGESWEPTEINEVLEEDADDGEAEGSDEAGSESEDNGLSSEYKNGEGTEEEEEEEDGGRQELCELEPVVVVCLLRIVVVYSLELERVVQNMRGLSQQQQTCLKATMRALGSTTVPSLKRAMGELFFEVRFSSLDGHVVSPSAALDRVSARMAFLSQSSSAG